MRMKIPAHFSSLSNASLIIATGTHDAKIYAIENGAMVEDEEIRRDAAVYSDAEGFFAHGARGEDSGYGEKLRKDFLKDLARHVKEIAGKHAVDKVVFFAPEEQFSETQETLSPELRSKIVCAKRGNYSKRKVLDLLGIAKECIEEAGIGERRGRAGKEAKKILETGE